ncbi:MULTISPECIES: sensor histidine kinase KdpD [unclassified Clostridium]|uniref:sensor histidine kinase n=1 Tax=unclassified Clostridium TaxID=2614128 RepID=UPI0011072AEE|nr:MULTISPECIES: sensor histidine kinase KdpD [unclassified Clostridium]
MEQEKRKSPEELLEAIKRQEQGAGRGHLKIFFGYAAGVGKTYAMLRAARSAKRRGVDVTIGYIEPHSRPDTIAQLQGLEQLPPLQIEHKGIKLREFDLDAAIARKPELILVDELAHTNAPGSRHAKRYQDVEELLRAGIDVYTTVNVQHIESLNDMVASITGITVHERIPDHVFDGADQVELVDIEPQDLIDRLRDGKIYREAQAQKALLNFFDVKNLVALREIALRRCADRINRMAEKVLQAQQDGYYTDEHILVCLSASPTNAKIIRTAARMAGAFNGSFTALYVESPQQAIVGEKSKRRLRENMHLAEHLGATVETVYGNDIAQQIAEFARVSGVSKIVVGRSNAQRKYVWSKATLTERLAAAAPNLDIYIIPEMDGSRYKERVKRRLDNTFAWADVWKSLLILALATAVGVLFNYLGFSEANIITVYILGVLITAVVTRRRIYSLVSSIISVLTFNYFFTAPYFTLSAYDKGYPATFLIMFLAAFITSTLAVQLKRQARQAAATAYRTKILLETNQLLQKSHNAGEIAGTVGGQLTKLLKRDVVFYLAQGKSLAAPQTFMAMADGDGAAYTGDNERAVANWVFKNNKHAGATTNTLGGAQCLYLAVRVNDKVYAVVGIAVGAEALDAFENSIMLSILGECALALENDTAQREREQAAILAKNEQLRANLLRSISHDLRTPLTSISGNAGILMANGEDIGREKKRQLYEDIYDDALWLINLVENLLSVTRIEEGTMRLNLTAELMDEVITEALRHINRKSVEHTIVVQQEQEFIMAKMDAKLIVQVIINIVDNAIKYTQPGSTITINTTTEGKMVVVTIADNGGGIPDEAKARIFDMFYTANKGIVDSRRSLGMGLALCKSIVNAHGGEIAVLDNKPAGTIFRFTLPLEEVTLHE